MNFPLLTVTKFEGGVELFVGMGVRVGADARGEQETIAIAPRIIPVIIDTLLIFFFIRMFTGDRKSITSVSRIIS
jgi:hypothetical protein